MMRLGWCGGPVVTGAACSGLLSGLPVVPLRVRPAGNLAAGCACASAGQSRRSMAEPWAPSKHSPIIPCFTTIVNRAITMTMVNNPVTSPLTNPKIRGILPLIELTFYTTAPFVLHFHSPPLQHLVVAREQPDDKSGCPRKRRSGGLIMTLLKKPLFTAENAEIARQSRP